MVNYLDLTFLGLNALRAKSCRVAIRKLAINETRSRCKRLALCVRPAGITSLGIKMYRKETAVYTQRVFMGIGLVRKTRKETERGNRYGRSQRIRARSFNQPANHRTVRPVRNGRSTLLLTVRTNKEEERRNKKKITKQERQNEGSNRERERADA